MSNCHPFNFLGGAELSKMGATWFVCYAYYEFIDSNYMAWANVKTALSRSSMYKRTRGYHKFWLERVLEMDDERLNTNKLDVEAQETKKMASILLQKFNIKI